MLEQLAEERRPAGAYALQHGKVSASASPVGTWIAADHPSA
jgi:hypothetical protein